MWEHERENDARRQEGLGQARATMMEIFEGPPDFTDLTDRTVFDS